MEGDFNLIRASWVVLVGASDDSLADGRGPGF